MLRSRLSELYGTGTAEAVRILYGGSVKSGNVRELAGQQDIDGALVGGASLDVDDFARLCTIAAEAASLAALTRTNAGLGHRPRRPRTRRTRRGPPGTAGSWTADRRRWRSPRPASGPGVGPVARRSCG